MSTYTRTSGERHLSRGLKRRLIGFFTVLLVAFGLSGLTVLPAAATDAENEPEQEEPNQEEADSPDATEDEGEAEEEHDAAAEPESDEPEDLAAEADSADLTEADIESAVELEESSEAKESSEPEPVGVAAEVVVEEAPAEQTFEDEDAAAVADDQPLIEEDLVTEDVELDEAETQESKTELAAELSLAVFSADEDESEDDLESEEPEYQPELTFYSSPQLSEWLIAREGVAVTGWGFPSGAEVTATVGSVEIGTAVTDGSGEVDFTVIAELEAGTYPLTLSAEAASASADIEVIADEDYYTDEEEAAGLQVHVSMNIASVSDVEAGDLMLRPAGFPTGPLDLYLNGQLHAGSLDSRDDYVLSDIDPGEYTALYRMGAYEADVSFVVVPDEQGEPPVSGTYQGESVTRDGDTVPLTVEVDEDGVLTSFSAPRMYACVSDDGGAIDPLEFDWSSLPPTPITVGQPFEIRWGATESWQNQVVSGVIHADGTASGEAKWENLCRGGIQDTWSAQIDGVLPDPEPTPDPTEEPEPTPDPTTDPEPTDEPEPTQDPTTDPEPTDEPDPSEDPTEEPTTEPTDPAPTEEPTQEPTEEPTSEPTSDPTSEPTEDPTADPTEEPTTGGIEAPAEAVVGSDITITVGEDHADQQVSVWLHSDPIHLGDPTVGADGTVTVSLPDGVTGEHTLRVYTAEGSLIGEAPITITTADTGTGNDDDEDDGESGTGGGSDTDDGPGTGGSDDEDPASTEGASDGDDDSGTGTSGGDSTDTDSEETTSGESTSGGSTDDSGSTDGGLAATGTTVAALVALGAGLLMLLGVGVLTISRRRAAE